MAKVLGLDLGTNSIGWALIDNTQNQILGSGVRIFSVGVNNLGEGENEISKNAGRTETRGTRRQFFRRKIRKKILLRELAKYEMCPFYNTEFTNWYRLNPYELRYKALTKEISLLELGRIFYHMIQRRGFQSNSRRALKEEGVIYDRDGKNKQKTGKTGIVETHENIGDKTLGSYLYGILPKENHSFRSDLPRIRNRYTTREMYIEEFERIWDIQKEHHLILTDDLKEIIGGRKRDGYTKDGILFYQRPLRSQKHLVGNCSLEQKKNKCPQSAIHFEYFRIYQLVNTIEVNGIKLSSDERDDVVNLLMRKEKIQFKIIRKLLGKLDSSYHFNYQDTDQIVGTHTISNLSNKKFFGENWFNFSDQQQHEIWHVLYFFDDKDKLKEYALNKWKFDEDRAENIAKFNLKSGYASLSTKAIKNISPFLKMGYLYHEAVVFGGVKNAFGDKWMDLTEFQNELILTNIPEIINTVSQGGFIENVRKFLISEFAFSKNNLLKLYHHSADIESKYILNKLPVSPEADRKIQSLRNPIVSTALFELRKVVNAIIDDFGKIDEIKVELARDLKSSKFKRNRIRKDQKRLETQNDKIKVELKKLGKEATHNNLLKYKLWLECQKICPYSGRQISASQLFNGDVQIEHIQPWSRSLNNGFNNKTLCFADENRAKGDKIPYEFYSKKGNWEDVKQRALQLFFDTPEFPGRYQKFKQFVKEKLDEDFTSRQLNDTRYISREARNYLHQICDKVMVSPGQVTAKLRHLWGLNGLLQESNIKERIDHRHHAIDALVLAFTSAYYVNEISKWNRYERNYDLQGFPKPWDNFWQDANNSVNQILVSYKQTNRVLTVRNFKTCKNGINYTNKGISARDQLHKETIYGKRQNKYESTSYRVRKPLESLTSKAHVDKIVDPAIKKLIEIRLVELGVDLTSKYKIPNNAFNVKTETGELKPTIFLPNKNGDPVPVRKVRIEETIGNAEKLKESINQYVNPMNNHHLIVYKNDKGELKDKIVSFWTAVERIMQKQRLYQLPEDGKEFVSTFEINDNFLIGVNSDNFSLENANIEEINKHLYKVQKIAGGSYFFEICFRHHLDSRPDKDAKKDYLFIKNFGSGTTGWNTYNPIKVKISTIGRVDKLL